MPSSGMKKRIEEGFPDANSQYGEEYIGRVLDAWKDQAHSLRGLSLAVLLSAALFELMAHAGALEFSFGPTKVTDSSLIQKALPAFVAYLVFDGILTTRNIATLEMVYRRLMERFHPTVYKSDLEFVITPRLHTFWNATPAPGSRVGSRYATFQEYVRALLNLAMICLIIGFQFYAYYLLFRKFHVDDLVLWASLLISITFLGASVVFAVFFWKEE